MQEQQNDPWVPHAKKPGALARLTKRFADFVRHLAGIGAHRTEQAGITPHAPVIVLAMIPRSHFTKTGPGVRAKSRRAFFKMTTAQRATAIAQGWYPADFERKNR